MSTQHPITPTPELVRDWARFQNGQNPEALWRRIATLAARWGADQELEACCGELPGLANFLRAARRPKPPSLKDQALAELEEIMTELHNETGSAFTASAIRRALEALPND
jgi:hypothetical protein